MMLRRSMKEDPALWAIPFYFGAMAAEHAWQRRRPELAQSPGAYEPRDTRASLDMGMLSVLAPVVLPPLLRHVTLGRGRWAKALLATGAVAAVATTAADRFSARRAPRVVVALEDSISATSPAVEAPLPDVGAGDRAARAIQRYGGPTAIIAGGISVATFLASRTDAETMWSKRLLPDLGGGLVPFALAMVGWDFLYYWSHRLQHEHRYLWSIHVVHHSSEHYNLSTALRQPVADSLGPMVPFGVLSLFGIRPSLVLKARGANLIWQFWIHTEVVQTLGRGEALLSTPSAHRVHHGANPGYLALRK